MKNNKHFEKLSFLLLFAAVLSMISGCSDGLLRTVSEVYISPTGEYQADAVQIDGGVTYGASAVYLEMGDPASFHAAEDVLPETTIMIAECGGGWGSDYEIEWTSDDSFYVIIDKCRYYDVSVEGDGYSVTEGLVIYNDKCEIHDVMTDGDNVEITATVCVSNNMSEAVQFEVSGLVHCYYKGEHYKGYTSVDIKADTNIETGEVLSIGPGEEKYFEIKLEGTKKPDEKFTDTNPHRLFVRITQFGAGE
ncbi:MAG: hypothetical protein J5476_06360 [Lachnospiraceae bacterium]|nr:hypothetical protein [Lachnospiraceae bacterium]